MGNPHNTSKKSKVDRTGKKFDSANHELQKQREKTSHTWSVFTQISSLCFLLIYGLFWRNPFKKIWGVQEFYDRGELVVWKKDMRKMWVVICIFECIGGSGENSDALKFIVFDKIFV